MAATVAVPGRLELIAERPPVFLDAAHNPDGAAALAEALPELAGGRRVVACLAVLADKDAGAMVAALAPVLERASAPSCPPRRWRATGARARLAPARPSWPSPARRPASRRRPSPASSAALRRRVALAPRASPRGSCSSPVPTTRSRPLARCFSRDGLCARIRAWSPQRRLRTALDDGPGRRRRRDRDPRLLRPRLPVRAALPLTTSPLSPATGFAAAAAK